MIQIHLGNGSPNLQKKQTTKSRMVWDPTVNAIFKHAPRGIQITGERTTHIVKRKTPVPGLGLGLMLGRMLVLD